MAIVVLLLQTDEMRSPQAAILNNFVSGWLLYLKETRMATSIEVSKVQVGDETQPILDVDVSPTEAIFYIASSIVLGMMNIHLWLKGYVS